MSPPASVKALTKLSSNPNNFLRQAPRQALRKDTDPALDASDVPF
ncbi:MAG: hypothetical protein ACOC1F_00180 [Myxococcota bacterium]